MSDAREYALMGLVVGIGVLIFASIVGPPLLHIFQHIAATFAAAAP